MSKVLINTMKMASTSASINNLKSKFRGSMLGSLLGDCLGSPYEGDLITSGDKIIIQRYFDKLESPDFKGLIRVYTDDTAMMKSLAKVLIDKPEMDYNYLAQLFVKEYFSEPNRGYGQNVVEVFKKLRKSKFDDVFKPAGEQFSGSGSYGNGGAMRIAPVALYYHDHYENMIEVARKSSQITHTNSVGVHGAILQCLAISHALKQDSGKAIDTEKFCDYLEKKIQIIEKENDDGLGLEDGNHYGKKLQSVRRFLNTTYHEELDEEVIVELGNSISAYESVPTAIYCFLRAQTEIPTVQSDNIFRRTIQYAITLGGDTDTIACMAGAIAGAYLGEEGINPNMAKQCEMYKEVAEMADDLYKAAEK